MNMLTIEFRNESESDSWKDLCISVILLTALICTALLF